MGDNPIHFTIGQQPDLRKTWTTTSLFQITNHQHERDFLRMTSDADYNPSKTQCYQVLVS